MSSIELDLNPDYWDCECRTHYIHKRTAGVSETCPKCKVNQEDQPDSWQSEIGNEDNLF